MGERREEERREERRGDKRQKRGQSKEYWRILDNGEGEKEG
jgi:hypothetical protein